MNQIKLLTAGFYKAWEYLIDYPLPPLPLRLRTRAVPSDRLVLTFFPLLGFLLGLIPMILGTLGRWFFNPVAGALLFAVSAVIILIGKDSGRGLALFCSFVMLRIFGMDQESALKKMNNNVSVLLSEARFSSALVFLVFLISALFFALGLGRAMSALPAIFAGDALIQAQLAAEDAEGTSVPRLNCKDQHFPEMPGIVIALLLLIAQPKLGTLVAIGVFLFFRRSVKRTFNSENGGVSASIITFCGFSAALLLAVLSLTLLSFR